MDTMYTIRVVAQLKDCKEVISFAHVFPAPSEHVARRKLIDWYLFHGHNVKSIECVYPFSNTPRREKKKKRK